MHELSSSFVLGYHGCDKAVGEALLDGDEFRPSENNYDWLGSGIYFWETNPRRGLDWAKELKRRRSDIREPFVVGAVIELGFCLDLLSLNGIEALRQAYIAFELDMKSQGKPLPRNEGGDDLLRRNLDCAVVNYLHQTREKARLRVFDSVRGVFVEGREIYADSGFREKTHIQICARNPACIKGVFRVRGQDL